MAKHWNQHSAPFIKKAMAKAMKEAKKSWKGKKSMTTAQHKRCKSLQARREDINKQIRKLRGK